MSLDPIYASFDADEQTFLRLRRPDARTGSGQRAQRRCRSAWRWPARRPSRAKGELNFLDNQVDPATGTIRGRAIFDNADRSLTPGLFVRLRVPGRGAYRGVLIQDRAVGTDLDKRFVFVVDGGQHHRVSRR